MRSRGDCKGVWRLDAGGSDRGDVFAIEMRRGIRRVGRVQKVGEGGRVIVVAGDGE